MCVYILSLGATAMKLKENKECSCFYLTINHCLERFSDIIGRNPSVSKTDWFHVDIFKLIIYIKMVNIL